MTDSKTVWVQAKEIDIGQRFKTSADDEFYTRIRPNISGLPSLADWSKGKGLGSTSREHVFAVSESFTLATIHPDNHVMPF